METGKWLSFSYRPVSDLKLTIGAEGQGTGGWAWPDLTGPVTLKRLTLSPLTIEAEYTTENTELFPVLWFLWEDGTVSEMESLLGGEGHGSGHGTVGEAWDYARGYSFDSVQDLSTLEAVIFGGMAYPLDHGEPYAVDLSARFSSWFRKQRRSSNSPAMINSITTSIAATSAIMIRIC